MCDQLVVVNMGSVLFFLSLSKVYISCSIHPQQGRENNGLDYLLSYHPFKDLTGGGCRCLCVLGGGGGGGGGIK